MAYQELLKNFNGVREYMREFYVYGFKSRTDFTQKSLRIYDDNKRRIESWLGAYLSFHQSSDRKNVFLSIDPRMTEHNPFYRALKTKSFTDGDITLHFVLLDILSSVEHPISFHDIVDQVYAYLNQFECSHYFDESTIRNKVKEYVEEGFITQQKRGKVMYYALDQTSLLLDYDFLHFFSEVSPCGVLGYFLLEKEEKQSILGFKHHYITSSLDSEILCDILTAMQKKKNIFIQTVNSKELQSIIPLKIMISVQSGRQYVMAYSARNHRINAYRLDRIESVQEGHVSERFDTLRDKLNAMQEHIWGVSTQSRSGTRLEHVEFTICYTEEEKKHILGRLEREKRCGFVEELDAYSARFTAEVYDSSELVPWIRTFLCRIRKIHFSNQKLEKQFHNDLLTMYQMYGLEVNDETVQ